MTNVTGVNFKTGGRIYYFTLGEFNLEIGDIVIVETEKGLQCAEVVISKKNIDETSIGMPLKPLLRIANASDKKQQERNVADATRALEFAKTTVTRLNLAMRILDAAFTFDRNQLLFNFVADGRVDFRELAKKLAQTYHTRIELRQIGVRDKAKEIGGLGPCGRFLCCSSFLTDFNSVSINMAKNQFIALNPSKINGVCGRLLCCLNYEDELYTKLKNNLPPLGSFIETQEGRGKVISLDIFKQSAVVEFRDRHTITINVGESDGKNT